MSNVKILIVEDETIAGEYIEKVLEDRGFEVVDIVSTGEAAVKQAEAMKPDLIFMDIILEGEMDGITAIEEIKSRNNIPFIFLTTHSDEKTLNRAKATVPYGYLVKPFKTDDLYMAIEVALYRHKAEEKLKESEIKYRTLVGHIPAITYIAALDESSTTLYVSPQIETILGISPADYKADPDFWMKHLHPDDRERVMDEIRRCHENGQPFISEYRMFSKDGRLVWISDNAVIVKDDKGKLLQLQGVIYDITARKQAEIAKENAYFELDQIFNLTPVGMWLINMENEIVKVNKRLLFMLGLSKEAIIGKKCFEIFPNTLCGSDRCPFKRMKDMSIDDMLESEVAVEIEDRGTVTFSVSAVPFLSMSGRINEIIESFTDITEKRLMERIIINLSELERRNMGQELHDGVGQMLTGVTMHVAALRKKMEGREGQSAEIRELSELVSELNKQMRDMTRGRFPMQLENKGLEMGIHELASENEKLFGVHCGVKKEGSFLIADEEESAHLFYIAREALHNSIKHGNAKKIEITLTGHESGYTMSISDDGRKPEGKKDNGMGLGMKIMRYRAGIIGAHFEAGAQESGFTVIVEKRHGGEGTVCTESSI